MSSNPKCWINSLSDTKPVDQQNKNPKPRLASTKRKRAQCFILMPVKIAAL